MYFKLNRDKSSCWWCGSTDLSGEHKIKKTDLELLYGRVYSKGNLVNHIKYVTEEKGENIQSSNSNRVKFEKNICKQCNSTKSQNFDKAYQQLIHYYFQNRVQIKDSKLLDLEKVFGSTWQDNFLNVKRYIGKHVGCRMAEIGLLPSKNLIKFLNSESENNDLKIVFQIKPYFFGKIDDPIDFIFLGPANPINNSPFKLKNLVTSFSGWYSIANLTWNYLHEIGISKGAEVSQYIDIQVVDYDQISEVEFIIREDTMMKDVSQILDELEYHPFKGKGKNIEHYKYMKSIMPNH